MQPPGKPLSRRGGALGWGHIWLRLPGSRRVGAVVRIETCGVISNGLADRRPVLRAEGSSWS